MRHSPRHSRTSGSLVKGGLVRFWGRHAVLAALANPERIISRIWGTREALAALDLPPSIAISFCDVVDLARLVARNAPHQGIVAEVKPLKNKALGDILQAEIDNKHKRTLVILDQVSDPQNIGAVLRSAAAFGAAAVITQSRHSPSENGVIAKAASGALERLPWVRVVNLARALDEIARAGWWRIGLDGRATLLLAEVLDDNPVALVFGAEGDGIRQNIVNHCEQLVRLPLSPHVESLNISNAAAVALYAVEVSSRAQEALSLPVRS